MENLFRSKTPDFNFRPDGKYTEVMSTFVNSALLQSATGSSMAKVLENNTFAYLRAFCWMSFADYVPGNGIILFFGGGEGDFQPDVRLGLQNEMNYMVFSKLVVAFWSGWVLRCYKCNMQSSQMFFSEHTDVFLFDGWMSLNFYAFLFFFAKVIFDYAMPPKCDDREMLKVLSLVRAAEDAADRAPKWSDVATFALRKQQTKESKQKSVGKWNVEDTNRPKTPRDQKETICGEFEGTRMIFQDSHK